MAKYEESTTELLHILSSTKKEDLDEYIAGHSKELPNPKFYADYLSAHHIETKEICQRCRGYLSKSYIYDLVNGKKSAPSRDIVLILCIAAEMDKKATRKMLENYGHRALYAKDTRDIIISTYINNGDYRLELIEDALYEHGCPLLHEG